MNQSLGKDNIDNSNLPNSLGIMTYNFPSIIEDHDQGILRVYESEQLPFKVNRIFTVMNTLSGAKRGQHAHKKCNQLLCCVSGQVELSCDNGRERLSILLSPNGDAIWVPNGIWAEQTYLENKSAIIVFCDQSFDEQDYIRDYKKYLKWKRINK